MMGGVQVTMLPTMTWQPHDEQCIIIVCHGFLYYYTMVSPLSHLTLLTSPHHHHITTP